MLGAQMPAKAQPLPHMPFGNAEADSDRSIASPASISAASVLDRVRVHYDEMNLPTPRWSQLRDYMGLIAVDDAFDGEFLQDLVAAPPASTS